MTTTLDRYRRIRRDDPYTPARDALRYARRQSKADDAGIPRDPDDLYEWPVTIGDRDYLLTVEPDTSISVETDADDCYGTVEELTDRDTEWNWGHLYDPDPPAIRVGHEGEHVWHYHPGDYYEPDSHRARYRGASRSRVLELVRADLEQEAAPMIRRREREEWPFRGVILTAADDEGRPVPKLSASLWGVDSLDNERSGGGSAYLLDVCEDLAGEIEQERAAARTRELAVTAHG